MSSSTAQQNTETTLFHRELQKKLRNKQKKLDKIQELEDKIKRSEINASNEQLEKINSKTAIEAEIAEVKQYLDLYQESLKEQKEAENKKLKQHQKDIQSAKKSVAITIANMISVASLLENEQTIPEDIEEGVKFFSELLNKLQGREAGQFHWRQERDSLINQWTKLASGSNDTVPHTDVSYGDLAQNVSEQISSGTYPEILEGHAKPKSGRQRKSKQNKDREQPVEEAQPAAEEVPETQPEEPEQAEVAQEEPETNEAEAPVEDEAQEEAPVEEEEAQEEAEEHDEAVEEVETEEPAAQEGEQEAETAPAEENKETKTESTVKRGENRQRGERGDRRRGGETRGRGEFRGRGENRGRGERRGRGENRGRGNNNTRGRGGFPRNQDDDGFIIVGQEANTNRGGRGRGNFRGERGGNGRGGRGGRGRGAPSENKRGGERQERPQTATPAEKTE